MVLSGNKHRYNGARNGEVFTPENIVCDMLDLVGDESKRLDARFLEPTAGNGNFLVEILRRKLNTVKNFGKKHYDRNLFIAISSIYAIEIQEDNVITAKKRMSDIIGTEYKRVFGVDLEPNMRDVVKYVLDVNIIWGDFLRGIDDNGNHIIIAKWIVNNNEVYRKDYKLMDIAHGLLDGIVVGEYGKIDFRRVYNQKLLKDNSNNLRSKQNNLSNVG